MNATRRDWLTIRWLWKLARRSEALRRVASDLVDRVGDPALRYRVEQVARVAQRGSEQLLEELEAVPGSAPAYPSRLQHAFTRAAARLGESSAEAALRWAVAYQLHHLREAAKLVDGRAHGLLRDRLIPQHEQAWWLLRRGRPGTSATERVTEGA